MSNLAFIISTTILSVVVAVAIFFLLLRCLVNGKSCPTIGRLDDKTAVVTEADSKMGLQLVRELCRRGARVIMGVKNTELGQDIAVELKAETNCEVIVEYCDLSSLKSVRDFCARVLEQESRVHILINNANVLWVPLERTAEGFEMHWGVNHMATFVMSQLMMPLLHRGAPDARVITVTSEAYKKGKICWEDPGYSNKSYNAVEAHCQSRLANVLFTRELARRSDGTGINSYCVCPGPTSSGLGSHILRGLDLAGLISALCCYLPWVRQTETAIQSIIYCTTEPTLSDQSGLYYSDCAVKYTTEAGANLEDAYRLWEMSERQAGLTS